MGNAKLRDNLGCSDHEVMFKILRTIRRAHEKFTTLGFRGEDFGLFRDLLSIVTWNKALEVRRAQKSWTAFKNHFLQA